MYGFLVWEPYWLSDDDRDAEVCYRIAYMNPAKLIRKYKKSTDEILKALREFKKDRSNYPKNAHEEQVKHLLSKVGDEFQVIEKHYIEHVKTTRLLGRQEGGQQWIPFPVNKERDYLEKFAELNEIDWTTVIEDTYDDKIHYVTTVIRELEDAEIQVEQKSKIQVNGLPFHHFTCFRHGGKNMGMPETMESVEDTINKRESLVTELISKAGGGSSLVNENLFPDPKKRQEWNKKKNKPGHSEFVQLDSVKNIIQHMSPNDYNPAVLDQINRMYDKVLPMVSRVSDALSSISERGEPGILFERKFQTNMIANTLMNRNMRQFINNVAESYFYQWQITYADQEKEVVFRDGKTSVTLNKRVGNMIYNDTRSVPRCRVTISENTKSQTFQMRWRSIWAELLPTIDPAKLPAHYAFAVNKFFETMPLDDDDKGTLDTLNELMMMIARLELVSKATGFQTQSQNNTMQGLQIDMQIQQIMSQMSQQFQQSPPTSHVGAEPQQQVQYPEQEQPTGNGQIINPQPEAASEASQTIPAMTGGGV
jgi:hypothetical protein